MENVVKKVTTTVWYDYSTKKPDRDEFYKCAMEQNVHTLFHKIEWLWDKVVHLWFLQGERIEESRIRYWAEQDSVVDIKYASSSLGWNNALIEPPMSSGAYLVMDGNGKIERASYCNANQEWCESHGAVWTDVPEDFDLLYWSDLLVEPPVTESNKTTPCYIFEGGCTDGF